MRTAIFAASPVVFAGVAVLGMTGPACSTSDDEVTMSREQLLDPQTCASCHEAYVREWSGSMHAYASEDPVFVAMNKRFQREGGGANKDFCLVSRICG